MIKKLGAAFISLALAIIGVEIAAGAYVRHHFGRYGFDLNVQTRGSMAEDGYQVWADPPNYTTWSLKGHFDEHGLRYPESVTPAKPPAVRRIFVLGGSMAYGSQPTGIWQGFTGQGELATNETIAGSMEQILNAKYPGRRFQVISAATNWSKLHQQMIHYLRQVKDFSPDLIISIDGQNDSTLHRESLNSWELTDQLYRDEVLGTAAYRLRPLLRASNALYLIAVLAFGGHERAVDDSLVRQYENVGRPADYEARVAADYTQYRSDIEKHVTEYATTMRYFHSVLEVDRVPHLFVLQPLIHLDQTKTWTRNERAIRGYIYSNIDEYLWRDNFYRRLGAEAADLIGRDRVPFEPLLDPFAGFDGNAYTDYCHLTPSGNRMVAQRLIAMAETRYPSLFTEAESLP